MLVVLVLVWLESESRVVVLRWCCLLVVGRICLIGNWIEIVWGIMGGWRGLEWFWRSCFIKLLNIFNFVFLGVIGGGVIVFWKSLTVFVIR